MARQTATAALPGRTLKGTQRERRAGLCSIPEALAVGGNDADSDEKLWGVTLILAPETEVPVSDLPLITCKDCEKLLRLPASVSSSVNGNRTVGRIKLVNTNKNASCNT